MLNTTNDLCLSGCNVLYFCLQHCVFFPYCQQQHSQVLSLEDLFVSTAFFKGCVGVTFSHLCQCSSLISLPSIFLLLYLLSHNLYLPKAQGKQMQDLRKRGWPITVTLTGNPFLFRSMSKYPKGDVPSDLKGWWLRQKMQESSPPLTGHSSQRFFVSYRDEAKGK